MDKQKVIAIQKDIDAALAEVAKKHGLSVSGIRGSFSETGLKFSAVMGDIQTIGCDADPEYVRNLERNGQFYGLDKTFIGKVVTIGARTGLVFQGLKGKKAAFKAPDQKVWLYDAQVAAQILKTFK